MTEAIRDSLRALATPRRLGAAAILATALATAALAFGPAAYPSVSGERLSGGGETAGGFFGRSVAITPDGNTAIVGGPRDSEDAGAAWIFTRSGATWTQQGGKLTPSGETGQGEFGWSVAISADGHTAVVGANDDDRGGKDIESGSGAAWVFHQSSSGAWTQVGSKLTPGDEAGKGHFGDSVAISADGSTVLVGGSEDGGSGAAWIYQRTGEASYGEQAKLTATSGEAMFGRTVALSADGSTAVVGAPRAGGANGAAYAFVRSGSSWTELGGALHPSDESGEGEFGYAVSLSADGGTALIGGMKDEDGRGAAWVFQRAGGEWHQAGPKLIPRAARRDGHFGASVSLSPEGTTALVGAPLDGLVTRKQGAAWAFKPFGGSWVQSGLDYLGLEPTGEEAEGEPEPGSFGRAVAASTNGYVLLVGAPRDLSNTGFAWSYVQSPPEVITGGASRATVSTVVLGGTVNPWGALTTDCRFEYGISGFEASVPCQRSPAPEGLPVPVSAEVTGLAASTLYRYRLVATTTGGTAAGDERLFSTHPPGTETSGVPSAPAGTGSGSQGAARGSSTAAGGVLSSLATQTGSSCTVLLGAKTASVDARARVAIRLARTGAFAGTCRGRLRLTVRVRSRSKLKVRTVAVGSFSVPAGRTALVRLKLNATGRSLLRSNRGRLNGRITIVRLSPAPTTARAASVRIRQLHTVSRTR